LALRNKPKGPSAGPEKIGGRFGRPALILGGVAAVFGLSMLLRAQLKKMFPEESNVIQHDHWSDHRRMISIEPENQSEEEEPEAVSRNLAEACASLAQEEWDADKIYLRLKATYRFVGNTDERAWQLKELFACEDTG
jgi:hypothetical protein